MALVQSMQLHVHISNYMDELIGVMLFSEYGNSNSTVQKQVAQ